MSCVICNKAGNDKTLLKLNDIIWNAHYCLKDTVAHVKCLDATKPAKIKRVKKCMFCSVTTGELNTKNFIAGDAKMIRYFHTACFDALLVSRG